jgi:hypothetical protein
MDANITSKIKSKYIRNELINELIRSNKNTK